MAEGCVPQVMSQRNRLGQVFIKVQGAGYSPGYLGYLKGVGEPGYIVVTQGGYEYLCFVLETAESLAVNNTVTVSLKSSTHCAGLFVPKPALRQPAFLGIGREGFFPFFGQLADIKLTTHYVLNRSSTRAIISLVWSIISGLTETEVIPHSTSFSVSSG